MKIAFIYSYRENESWSTPMSLAVEFQERGWEVNIYSLLSSSGNYTDTGIRMMHDEIESGNYSPDIIMFMDWGRFDSKLLDKDLYPRAYWIAESGDDPQNYTNNSPKQKRFNLTVTPDYQSSLKYLASGINAIWMPHWADTMIHHPINVNPKFDAVSTRGKGSSQILDRLEELMPVNRYSNKNGFDGIAHSEALQLGKMVVQHSRWGEITRRIFEAMACGRMVITDRLDPETHIEELFKENVHIVYYDDITDCINKINHYCIYPADREKIAIAGRAQVVKNHTQRNRVDTLIKEFRSWKAKKK